MSVAGVGLHRTLQCTQRCILTSAHKSIASGRADPHKADSSLGSDRVLFTDMMWQQGQLKGTPVSRIPIPLPEPVQTYTTLFPFPFGHLFTRET
jgi:hypothetical protein